MAGMIAIETEVRQPAHYSLSEEEWAAFQGSMLHLRMRRNRVRCDMVRQDSPRRAVMWNTVRQGFHDLVSKWVAEHATNFYFIQMNPSHMPMTIYFLDPKNAVEFKLTFSSGKFKIPAD